MKKLVFLFAMVFAVSMAMAQTPINNSSTVSQSGNDNDTQVSQSGDENVSTATQTGDDNLNILDQSNDKNEFTLLQRGDDNISKLEQGVASVASYKENVAEVQQIGNRNLLRNYSNGNAAVQGRENYLWLNQQGNNNTAGVNQDSYDQDAYIDQVGLRNDAFVKQDAHLSHAEIAQQGNDNYSNILQDNDLHDGVHYARHQVIGDNNTMNAEQRGYDNHLIVDQRWAALANNGNIIDVYQNNNSDGDGNRAYLRMSGSNNEVNFSQSGSWNQIGGKDMYPNLAIGSVTYSDMLNYKGHNSTIDISQSGNQNVVNSDMNNSNGDIDIEQSGNVNVTELFINQGTMGSGNDANISQTSSNNFSTNTVVGNNNSILVTQN